MTSLRVTRLMRRALAIFFLVGSCEWGWGQVTATISGRVEDATGAAVGGATVTVTSPDTGAVRLPGFLEEMHHHDGSIVELLSYERNRRIQSDRVRQTHSDIDCREVFAHLRIGGVDRQRHFVIAA